MNKRKLVSIFGVIMLAIIGLILFMVFVFYVVNDVDAEKFAKKVITDVSQDWDAQKIKPYLDTKYSVAWRRNNTGDSEKLYNPDAPQATEADLANLFNSAKNNLGKFKIFFVPSVCQERNDVITCSIATLFQNDSAEVVMSFAPVTAGKEYKIKSFIIYSNKAALQQ